MSEIKKNIGDELKKMRRKIGFTSAEKFAAENNINEATYRYLEGGYTRKYSSGFSRLRIDILMEICSIHKIKLSEFFKSIGL